MKKILCVLLCYVPLLHGRAPQEAGIVQLKEGNLSLPSSQQPGPLFSFGQNIIDQHDLLVYCYGDYLKATGQHFGEVIPALLYGINDHSSLFINVPVAVDFKAGRYRSSGIEDMIIFYEFAWHTKETVRANNQATVVAALQVPTGSAKKKPPTGAGSASFFLGLTASHLSIDWYTFASTGALITPSTHRTDDSSLNVLYQAGVGHNITTRPGWIFSWLIELDGSWSNNSGRRGGRLTKSSGGTLVLLGPSLWISSKDVTLQIGIAGAIAQSSSITKDRYYAAINLGWKFSTDRTK